MLPWFRKNKRDLPWRKTADPYKIWISEIMLQQTQVKTATPYYERWLREFPDIRALARAPLSAVLKKWEGLGYYTRAKNIHQAAKIIAGNYRGKFPDSFDQIHALPGIGRYTAGAIASIAFGIPVPVLDGNVMRVLARVFSVSAPIDLPATRKKLWGLAEGIVPQKHPGDFNQSLMELGATLCTPRNPSCPSCPLSGSCKARRNGIENSLPRKRKSARTKKVEAVCGIVRCEGKILLEKREEGLWAGLWQLPTFRVEAAHTPLRALKNGLGTFGVGITREKPEGVLKRSYTVHQENLHVFSCRGRLKRNRGPNLAWASKKDFKKFPFSSAYAKILKRYPL
ncbi:MAG TPA: A/G-specific adenine glycosylase [Candidatus Omnitrophota bacterium]|nr:A/G-specific adenine glycosylase [Candidatus Omnitrophota bacterium]